MSVGRRNIFRRQPRAGTEEELFHLLDEKSLRLRGPGLQPIFIEQHLCRSTHSPQACLETFLKIFWPNSESKGGSSRPSISFLFRVQKTMCAIDSCSHNPLYWRVLPGRGYGDISMPAIRNSGCSVRPLGGKIDGKGSPRLVWDGTRGPESFCAQLPGRARKRADRGAASSRFRPTGACATAPGLAPYRAKDAKLSSRASHPMRRRWPAAKPAFRKALDRRHCQAPISTFYEWENHGKKSKLAS